jgi:hypothetical protein
MKSVPRSPTRQSLPLRGLNESFGRAAELAERLGEPELLARATLCLSGPGVGMHVVGLHLGDVRVVSEEHLWKAHNYLEIGDLDAAQREEEIQGRIAETSRQAYLRRLTMWNRARSAFSEGRFEEAENILTTEWGRLPSEWTR